MTTARKVEQGQFPEIDQCLDRLHASAEGWAQSSVESRTKILQRIVGLTGEVAKDWANAANKAKMIPAGSSLEGEEWISGPFALMDACNHLTETLRDMGGKRHVKKLGKRTLQNGNLAVKVLPTSLYDYLLFSGVRAEVWMQDGVSADNLGSNTASAYDIPEKDRKGQIALVLGAGNIAAITPLDVLNKTIGEHKVVILKLNPVNDYLEPFITKALSPLIESGALEIVKGGADVGAYLCENSLVTDIHITGSVATHDAIVWGTGAEAEKNRKSAAPKLKKTITSELGAVCPTIVVPGPWSQADLRFQAEEVATQKLHNSGFNCIACQVLIMPEDWDMGDKFVAEIEKTIAKAPRRGLYYPGAADRQQAFEKSTPNAKRIARGSENVIMAQFGIPEKSAIETTEVFAPALSVTHVGGSDAANYLQTAIEYANDRLYGTLGANILIHPATIRAIGKKQFEALVCRLKYGAIGINTWTGLGFLTTRTTWGAFPGHTLDDIQSGLGVVHNTMMFDKAERSVVTKAFRPFPRGVLSGSLALLPRPPWFVTNRRGRQLGIALTRFQQKPSLLKIPGIFYHALLG